MSPHNCSDFPTSFNIVHYVNHYLNLACCNIICIFLWAYCHNNISPVAPKLIKHSTSYIFLPLFSSLHIHYTISGRKCQEKKGRFLQKNSNKSLDFGSNMCYNGSVYPERNENDSHYQLILLSWPANLASWPEKRALWGNCQAYILRKSYQMLKSSGYA